MRAGTTYHYSLQLTEAAVDELGVVVIDAEGNYLPGPAMDLSGCTARMDVRARPADAQALLTLDETSVACLADGVIDITLSPAQTDLLGYDSSAGKFRTRAVYDIEVVYPDGAVTRPVAGTFLISGSITRSA